MYATEIDVRKDAVTIELVSFEGASYKFDLTISPVRLERTQLVLIGALEANRVRTRMAFFYAPRYIIDTSILDGKKLEVKPKADWLLRLMAYVYKAYYRAHMQEQPT
jgi:hypothetical protein